MSIIQTFWKYYRGRTLCLWIILVKITFVQSLKLIVRFKQTYSKCKTAPSWGEALFWKSPTVHFTFLKISWEKSLGQNYMSEFLWKWAFSLKLLVYKYFKIDFCRNFEVIIFLTRITWHITLSFSHFFCRLAKFAHLSRDLKG